MTNTPDNFHLDTRIRERLLKKHALSSAAVEAHMAALKDGEPASVVIDLEQPAMAKPPVVVAPAPQPVQPVRNVAADLPPPPPGLIKESPTPPYTPMVIESSPPHEAVNGEAIAEGQAQASAIDVGAAAAAGEEKAGEEKAGEEKSDLDDEWGNG
ncbi:MAG TPA: hypothetical protein VL137_00205 [Polyangiaceae bacterium]|nr:hypothetical protein [Polyangiaceae bacterium]